MRPIVCMYSGGVCSHLAAKRAVEKYGRDRITLLFTDTLKEDPDLYRFIQEGADWLGIPLTHIADGRTIRQVAIDERMMPSSLRPICSRVLKVEMGDRWVKENRPGCLRVLGYDWTEPHRIAKFPFEVWCPMSERPYLLKSMMFDEVERDGLRIPDLYKEEFAHNNCGGGCVRAGQAAWAHLLRTRPWVYAGWEEDEEAIRDVVGDYSILADRRGDGKSKTLTLRAFRTRVQENAFDIYDIGGCGCFLPEETA